MLSRDDHETTDPASDLPADANISALRHGFTANTAVFESTEKDPSEQSGVVHVGSRS